MLGVCESHMSANMYAVCGLHNFPTNELPNNPVKIILFLYMHFLCMYSLYILSIFSTYDDNN